MVVYLSVVQLILDLMLTFCPKLPFVCIYEAVTVSKGLACDLCVNINDP